MLRKRGKATKVFNNLCHYEEGGHGMFLVVDTCFGSCAIFGVGSNYPNETVAGIQFCALATLTPNTHWHKKLRHSEWPPEVENIALSTKIKVVQKPTWLKWLIMPNDFKDNRNLWRQHITRLPVYRWANHGGFPTKVMPEKKCCTPYTDPV